MPPSVSGTALSTADGMLDRVRDIHVVWERIRTHADEEFHTVTGLPFTYLTSGNTLRVTRGGREIDRSLSRGNFECALGLMPASGPGDLRDVQGSSYTWAILMDARIRHGDW